MAEVEEAENPHANNKAHEWREQAETAPNDPSWVCDNCHTTTPTWQPICPSCEAFDKIAWQSPSKKTKSPPLKTVIPLY